jgi:hypothetical protein
MADNITVKDNLGVDRVLATHDAGGGIHKPKQYVADGDNLALGSTTDAAVTNPSTNSSLIAFVRGMLTALNLGATAAKQEDLKTLAGAVTETAPATDTASSGLNGRLQRIAQRITALIALVPAALGSQTNAGSLSVAPSKDQDPILDHTNGTKTSVTTSATIITPPTGCKYIRISSDVDIFVNTAAATAVDDGTSIRIVANQPEIIPVTAATAVKALSSSGTATVRCTPYKER